MEATAYVDGSYNAATGQYGAGVVMLINGKQYDLSHSGKDSQAATMRNVAGEILGALVAAELGKKVNITHLHIYHDYEGLAKWVNGEWKAKNPYTQTYTHMMRNLPFQVTFHKVAAHTGDHYNEIADRLAKQGAGLN